jgi:4-amino-4-deoxy-L-arabinose transferase-like glycosyltransferase
MATFEPSRLLLYRWRYIIGYSLVGLLLAALLVFAGLYVPGGISAEEMRAAVRSESVLLLNPSTWGVTSAPFYMLQHLSFNLFGVSDFTIKLPSLIIALLSAIGLILLLRRWFKPNIAVLASLIAVTTGQFLFVAQNGAPGVSYIFWPVVLLLLGTQVTRAKKFRVLWKWLFAAAAALSLYTPLSIYPILAIILAIILHPHLRNAVRRLSKFKIAVGILIAAIILTPLALNIYANPSLGLALLGVPSVWPPDLLANLETLLKQYFIFWEPSTTTLMTPVFGLGSVLLIGLGLYRLIRTRETTRSYLIIIWIISLVPILILNPRFTSVIFVPAVLLLAAGLTSLIGYWYRLFPLNPYARITGLLPLIILVIVLMGSGLDRFIYGYHYDPNTAVNFSRDLKLIPKDTTRLVVSNDELAFYQVVAKHRDNLNVSTTGSGDRFTATRDAKKEYAGYAIDRIITSTYAHNGDRLYIYKKISQ